MKISNLNPFPRLQSKNSALLRISLSVEPKACFSIGNIRKPEYRRAVIILTCELVIHVLYTRVARCSRHVTVLLCRSGAGGHDGRRGERAVRRAPRPTGVAGPASSRAARSPLALPR